MVHGEPSMVTSRTLYVPAQAGKTGSADGNMTFDLLLVLGVLVAIFAALMMDLLSADAVMVPPSPRRWPPSPQSAP